MTDRKGKNFDIRHFEVVFGLSSGRPLVEAFRVSQEEERRVEYTESIGGYMDQFRVILEQ